MFSSSSVINTAAAHGSSNLTHHHHQQHLYHHHYSTSLVTGMVAQDAQQHDDQVARESTIITSFGNTIMNKKPGSDARVTKKKSDKRSKIKTSQGFRDRRVRLSIDIARKFFDLQDLLGFEQPSRTVEWLLTKSNKAILEVSGASSSTTSSSEDGFKISSSSRNNTCTCSTDHQLQQVSSDDYMKNNITMKQKAEMLTRESRERARARARARTSAKLWNGAAAYGEEQLEETRKEVEEQLKEKQHLDQIHSYVVPNYNLLTLADWDIISSVNNIPDQLPKFFSNESIEFVKRC